MHSVTDCPIPLLKLCGTAGISIFQKPIEAQCRFNDEIEAKIGEVVRHEIAHHFGLDEKTLRKIEGEKRRRK